MSSSELTAEVAGKMTWEDVQRLASGDPETLRRFVDDLQRLPYNYSRGRVEYMLFDALGEAYYGLVARR